MNIKSIGEISFTRILILSLSCDMLKKLLFLTLLLCFNSFGQIQDSFFHDGEERTFVYYIPDSWNASSEYPLLIVLHGLTQTGNGIMNIPGFNEIADNNNFIACYPDGLNGSWNADMNSLNSDVDDLGFVEQLINYFETNYNTDSQKRYLTGFSNGGFLSHKIASESELCIAAIGTVSGNLSTTTAENFNPLYPTSVLHIHGTSDAIVPYNGGASTGASVDEAMTLWKNFLSCDPDPEMQAMPNPNVFDFSYPERYIYQNCSGAELEHIKVIGGGHQWPGIETLVGGLGTINMDFYSPQVIWDFLDGKSCPQTVGQIEKPHQTKHLLKIVDYIGREVKDLNGIPLLYIYSDGSIERKFNMLE